jgi:methylmalonyl-CoA/ethylmalonyl-CoA epimerase
MRKTAPILIGVLCAFCAMGLDFEQPNPLTPERFRMAAPTGEASSTVNQSERPERPMESTALGGLRADHILIGVSNFEDSVRWYQDKLGFSEEMRWTVEGLPDLQLAYLMLNGFRLEIIGTSQPRVGSPSSSDFADHLRTQGFAHLCFVVDDVDEALAELNRRGVPTFVSPETYPLSNVRRRVAFIQDNNGNVIEMAGPLLPAPHAGGLREAGSQAVGTPQ